MDYQGVIDDYDEPEPFIFFSLIHLVSFFYTTTLSLVYLSDHTGIQVLHQNHVCLIILLSTSSGT